MDIDPTRVRQIGGKIRQVGEDAQAFLGRMSGPAAALKGFAGLGTIATLRQVNTRLTRRTSDLATASKQHGGNVITAADNHVANDAAQKSAIDQLTPALGR
ncbi:hypothetical protein AB0I28_19120 [Phytomonospora sp. NPDC050363]|uniref:hypothetical protein n=1 Tax=Phytomonospora sp. NPDC050363 TaxID=3155642 RepID=UPI0033D1BE25